MRNERGDVILVVTIVIVLALLVGGFLFTVEAPCDAAVQTCLK